MKLPTRRIQWLCLAISVYYLWITIDSFIVGYSTPKGIIGGLLGFIIFALIGFLFTPQKKKE